MADFLLRYRAEVTDMILTEYDEERHLKLVQKNSEERGRQEGREEGRREGRREGREEGRREGRQEGRLEGHNEINRLNQKLLSENRMEDMKRAMIDPEFQKQLLRELEEGEKRLI